jgi:hypothetical protein
MGGIILRAEDAKAADEVLAQIKQLRRRAPSRGRELVPLAKRLGLVPFKKRGGDPKYERPGVHEYVTIPNHKRPLCKGTYHSVLDQLEAVANCIHGALGEAKREEKKGKTKKKSRV